MNTEYTISRPRAGKEFRKMELKEEKKIAALEREHAELKEFLEDEHNQKNQTVEGCRKWEEALYRATDIRDEIWNLRNLREVQP
jgi:hypothetical protein